MGNALDVAMIAALSDYCVVYAELCICGLIADVAQVAVVLTRALRSGLVASTDTDTGGIKSRRGISRAPHQSGVQRGPTRVPHRSGVVERMDLPVNSFRL